MTQDIKSFVQNCEVCAKVKYNQRPLKGQLTTRPLQSPWAQLSVDTAVSQTRSKRGNSNLIVVQDLYTKYIELFPVRHRTGKSVVKTLETIFDRWGTPRSIITDNGTEYINKDVRAFLLARGVKHVTTPLSHPQSNPVERVNRTIKPMISAFINENHREWDENLSKIQLAYNTVPHSGSRVSPFLLNHGREAVVKHVTKLPETIDNPTIKDSIDEWTARMSKIDDFRHKIENQIKKNSDKRLAKINSNRVESVEIKVGTEVYYSSKKLSNKAEAYSSKLAHKFTGPAFVHRVCGPVTVELTDERGKVVGKYSISDLKIPRRTLRVK